MKKLIHTIKHIFWKRVDITYYQNQLLHLAKKHKRASATLQIEITDFLPPCNEHRAITYRATISGISTLLTDECPDKLVKRIEALLSFDGPKSNDTDIIQTK